MPTYKVTDPDTGRVVNLTGDSPPTEQELSGIFSKLNTPALSQQSDPTMEYQNWIGAIFNVPAAAVRSAIQGKGYTAGAMNPSKVKTFQQMSLDAPISDRPDQPVRNFIKGVGRDTLGVIADTATNPAMVAIGAAGRIPGVNKLSSFIKGTSPAKKFDTWLNKDRSLVDIGKHLPKKMDTNWFMERAKAVKDVVDDTITGLRNEYKKVLGDNADKVVKNIKSIPQEVREEFGLGEEATIKKLWEARGKILQDISDSSWSRPDYYKKIKPRQEDLQEVSQTLKNLVHNNVDQKSREALYILDPKYETAMSKGRKLINMVYEPQSKTYKISGLVDTFNNPEALSSKQAFNEFKQFSDSLKQVEKDMAKYAARKAQKKIAKQVAIRGAEGLLIGGVASKLMSR